MFDPAAMGTLVIGLDNVRRHSEADTRYPVAEPVFSAARRTSAMRARIADALRAAADRLQPATEVGAGTRMEPAGGR